MFASSSLIVHAGTLIYVVAKQLGAELQNSSEIMYSAAQRVLCFRISQQLYPIIESTQKSENVILDYRASLFYGTLRMKDKLSIHFHIRLMS